MQSYGMVPPHVKITSSFVEGQNKCFEEENGCGFWTCFSFIGMNSFSQCKMLSQTFCQVDFPFVVKVSICVDIQI